METSNYDRNYEILNENEDKRQISDEDEINFNFNESSQSNETSQSEKHNSIHISSSKIMNISLKTINAETKRKREEALVKYCIKNLYQNNILDISFSIQIQNLKITRRIYLGDNIDINIFSHVIFEVFDFIGKPWKINFSNYHLIGERNSEKVVFETNNTKKEYYLIFD